MAECLRGEGIDVPDLDDDGGVVKGESADYDTEAFEVAQQKCADEVGTPPAASERKQSGGGDDFAEFTRKAVECYREKGYEVVDPAPNEPLAVPSDAPEEVVAECGGQAMKIGG
ncbi:hypothetical protein [Microbacterium sp. NPDC089695]|uniref:hypothetical protein n=1 Tax=Microbacterium sp. NPDC089695 TaxID=3364198 RepID=UPI00382F5E5F